MGLVGTVAMVLLALLLRRSLLLSGVWGCVGIMLGGGMRWYNAATTPEEARWMRPLLGAGVGAVLMLTVALATSGRWNEHHFSDFTPGPYFQKAEPTMVVLCPATPRGDAYTYQAPASQTPRCSNGAVPKIVVRG